LFCLLAYCFWPFPIFKKEIISLKNLSPIKIFTLGLATNAMMVAKKLEVNLVENILKIVVRFAAIADGFYKAATIRK
jgi:hypothetical protein